MNWIRNNLKWMAVLAISLLAAGAGVTIWQQQNANTELTQQLADSNTQRDALDGQLRTAAQTISAQSGQIITLRDLNRQQAADVTAQLQRLEDITHNATARAVKLEAITHEYPDAQRWGDTRLPDAVARLLDNTATDSDPAGPPDRNAGLRAGSGVPDPSQQPEDQPPAGAEPAGHTDSP